MDLVHGLGGLDVPARDRRHPGAPSRRCKLDPVSYTHLALPLLLTWALAPEIAYRISRPIRHAPAPPTAEQNIALRTLARRTWLFFEDFVGPNDHWLPPDHFQESPRGTVAAYTSPTNIGLLLLSTLAAYDLGYIGITSLVSRCV